MDGIRATPYQRPIAGTANEILGGLLGYMRDPRRTQQMQGLAGLLESTGIPKTVERLAFGEPLTNIRQANMPLLRPETAEALLTLAPVPPAAGRATMAVGRAGERLAERVVPQVMERGGMPAGLLEGMSSRTVSPLTVYHGSPARFERFDPTKIGSGEGAQAYGYGHYVAESPEVAKTYKTAGTSKYESPEAYAQYMVETYSNDPVKAAKVLKRILPAKGEKTAAGESRELIEGAIAAVDSGAYKTAQPGLLYEIDLPDEQIAKMLDWDKPLSKQPEEIRKPIIDFIQENLSTELKSAQTLAKKYGDTFNAEDLSGRNLYQWLTENQKNSPEAAADMLRQAGVPGIRYLDQSSRGVNQTWVVNNPKFGSYDFPSFEEAQAFIKSNPQDKLELIEPQKTTSNFVVFPGNEDLLTILKRNGGLLGP
jgi:hypothetical protein